MGVGSVVGDVVGATDGDGDSEADAVRVGEAWASDRRDILVSAASNGSGGNDDGTNGEQADLLARHSAVKLQDVMAELKSGPVGETGPRAQTQGMEPPNQLPIAANRHALDCPVHAVQ